MFAPLYRVVVPLAFGVFAIGGQNKLTAQATPLTLVADARLFGTGVRLTPSEFFRRGAAWFPTKMPVRSGFSVSFEFQITDLAGVTDQSGAVGGDGLALVIQDQSATAIGNFGQFQGYGGISRSLAVEFESQPIPLIGTEIRSSESRNRQLPQETR